MSMSTTRSQVPRTYEAAVKALARWQRAVGGQNYRAYSFPDPEKQVVRLLEVSPAYPDTGELMPVTWGRSAEVPFRSTIAMATPKQWERVQSGALPLPDGWILRDMRQIWPDDRS